jgi:hypothetical protein
MRRIENNSKNIHSGNAYIDRYRHNKRHLQLDTTAPKNETVCTVSCVVLLHCKMKGTVSRDCRPSVFSWINSTWVTDQQLKIFLHGVANSQRNLRICVDSALCRIGRRRKSPNGISLWYHSMIYRNVIAMIQSYHLMLSSRVIIPCYHPKSSSHGVTLYYHLIYYTMLSSHVNYIITIHAIFPCYPLVLSSTCYNHMLPTHLMFSSMLSPQCYYYRMCYVFISYGHPIK